MRERGLFNLIRFVLEDVLPPVIRDSRLFYGVIWLLYRAKTQYQSQFRSRVPSMQDAEYADYYATFPGLDSETDCNQACIDKIIENIKGSSALDVGCGRGFVANLIQTKTKTKTTGVDFIINEEATGRFPNVEFLSSKIESLPFDDNAYDTVVCTHTLEHILDLPGAIRELRRVAGQRLIIVVPREREYKYSFNLHVHFFPYLHSFLKHMVPLPEEYHCEVVDGDIFYIEDFSSGAANA